MAVREPVDWLTSEPDYEDQRRSVDDLSLQLSEHIGVVGATGSGKTFFVARGLMQHMKRRYPNALRVVIDSTDDDDMEKLLGDAHTIYGNEPPAMIELSSRHTLVWKTKNSKIPKQYAQFFRALNDLRREVILIIDELASITGEAAQELEVLLKQIRKHGGTVVACSQSIASVEPEIFRQMTHFFQFFVNNSVYDTSRSRAYLNLKKEDYQQPRYEHGFWYRRTRGNFAAQEFKDMQEFFRL